MNTSHLGLYVQSSLTLHTLFDCVTLYLLLSDAGGNLSVVNEQDTDY